MPQQTRITRVTPKAGKEKDQTIEDDSKKCDDSASSAGADDEDGVRRSSRKRTTSKWLEGMQTSFRTPKAKIQKLSGSGSKDEKLNIPSKSTPKAAAKKTSPKAKVIARKSPAVSRIDKEETSSKNVEKNLSTGVGSIPASSIPVHDMSVDEKELENYLSLGGSVSSVESSANVEISIVRAASRQESVGEDGKNDPGSVSSSSSVLQSTSAVSSTVLRPTTVMSSGLVAPKGPVDSSPLLRGIDEQSGCVSHFSEKDSFEAGEAENDTDKMSETVCFDEEPVTGNIIEKNNAVRTVKSQFHNWIPSPGADVKSLEDATSAAVTLATMQVETVLQTGDEEPAAQVHQLLDQFEDGNWKDSCVKVISVAPTTLTGEVTDVINPEISESSVEPSTSIYGEVTTASQTVINSILANESTCLSQSEGSQYGANSGLTILTAAATADIPAHLMGTARTVSGQETLVVPSSQITIQRSDESSPGFAVLETIKLSEESVPNIGQTIPEQTLTIPADQTHAVQWRTLVMDTDMNTQQELVIQPETQAEVMFIPPSCRYNPSQAEESTPNITVVEEHQNPGSSEKPENEIFVETVNIDELPDEVASIIKNYASPNASHASGSAGIQDALNALGRTFKVFKMNKTEGQQFMENMQHKTGASSMSLLYDKDGNCIKLPQRFLKNVQSSDEALLKCSNCDYITDKRANWYKHKKMHEGSRPYRCNLCDYRATTSSNLKRHHDAHTGVRLFACKAAGCTAKFKQKIHLDRHVRYKHLVKEVHCELCDYTCALENPDLKIHMMRKHSEKPPGKEKPVITFKCEECSFETTLKKDLQQHMKFHSKGPELKLFCEHCSFVTDCPSRLNRHLLVHTKQKPFKCGVCEYRASQKEHVIRHMRMKHKLDIHKAKEVVMKPLIEENLSNPDSLGDETLSSQEAVIGDVVTGHENLIQGEQEMAGVSADEMTTTGEEESKSEQKGVILTSDVVGSYQVSSEEFLTMADKIETGERVEETGQVVDGSEDMGDTGDDVSKDEKCLIIGETEPESSVEYPKHGVVVGTSEPEIVTSEPEIVTSCPVVTVGSSSEENMELFVEAAQNSEPKVKPRTVYKKKKYAKCDFSNLPKIFNCEYCTMKFAKLLNLYKHVHVQHATVHPMPPTGTYACVVCDFKTPQKKALLIHLRRHNPESDTEETPNIIFSCVLCQYCTPKRRNLYWHLKKKHKISLLVNKDGTAKCVVDENGPVSVVSAQTEDGAVDMDGQQVALSVEEPRGSSSTAKVVNVSDLAHSLIQPKVQPGTVVQGLYTQTVEVIMNEIKVEECMVSAEDNDAAVAIEGLQALAEQTIPTYSEVVVCGSGTIPIHSDVVVEPDVDVGHQNIELSSEQVMELSSGDYIEIDGEMYEVEFAPEVGEEALAIKTQEK